MILRPSTKFPKPSKLRTEITNAVAFDRHAKVPPAWEVLDKGLVTLKQLIAKWRLPPLGEAALLKAFDSDPVSHLRSTPKSTVVLLPSSKMRRYIQCGARTVAYAIAQYLEYDAEILLYVDQPLAISIHYRDSMGRPREKSHKPDFLAVRTDGVHLYECRPIEWLREKSQRKHPYPVYVYGPKTRTWHNRAAEEAFTAYGFTHHVVHSGEVNTMWLRGVRFLSDFMAIDPPDGVDEARAALRQAKSMTFLQARLVPGTSREAWYWLIASGEAAFDLERDPIDRSDLLDLACVHDSHAALVCHRLALDSKIHSGVVPSLAKSAVLELDPGRRVVFRDIPHQVLSRDKHELVLLRLDGPEDPRSAPTVVIPLDSVPVLVESETLRAVAPKPEELIAQHSRRILSTATNDERLRAVKRWSAICQYRESKTVPARVSRSALFKHLGWARDAARLYGSEFLGMFSRCDGSSSVARASDEQKALLAAVAEAFHRGKRVSHPESDGAELPLPSRRRFKAAYADYERLSRARGLPALTERSLRRKIDDYSLEKSERARRGKRAADKYAAPQGRLTDTLPVHGMRPYEVAHVDHQLLDIWCLSGATGAVLGRPWLTLIIDAWSRMPLGFVLRFDRPSVFSVMCAIYDCVRRNGRFPDSLVSDRGSEFESPDLLVALGYLRTAHVRRPPSKPRFGAIIERVFGSIKTRLIELLSGSIDTLPRARELSSSHDPASHALWTLPALSRLLDEYLFEHCPTFIHKELGCPLKEVFDFGMAHAGERIARHVPLDDTLSLALSQTVPGLEGTRKVRKKGGPIRVSYLDYHHPDFSDGRVAGNRIPVRRCPADASFVYVFLPHLCTWERARLVTGSIDLTQCSWAQARGLLEERARQRAIATLPPAIQADAVALSKILLSIDEYETQQLERRREVDADQRDESLVRSGIDPDPGPRVDDAGSSPASRIPSSVPDSLPAPIDPELLRSYDEDPD